MGSHLDVYSHAPILLFILFFYRITEQDGDIKWHYKHWSADDEWLPTPDQPVIDLFKRDSTQSQTIPQGYPQLVQPDWRKKVAPEDVQSNIEKLSSTLTSQQKAWWDSFLQHIMATITDEDTHWLKKFLECDRRAQVISVVTEPLQSPLAPLIEAERRRPLVCTSIIDIDA